MLRTRVRQEPAPAWRRPPAWSEVAHTYRDVVRTMRPSEALDLAADWFDILRAAERQHG
jgi:hypothetical protein